MTKQEILDDLREKILSEYFKQGQSLIERELCEMYKVSRTPMREVLWKLAIDGIVEHKPSRGFFVRKLEWDQIFEIFQAREAIEGMATRLACQKAALPFIKKLKELKKKLIEIDIKKNPADGSRIGRIIHQEIINYSSNRFIKEFYNKIKYLAKLTSNISTKSSIIEYDSKTYHLAIIQAIINGDAEKSELFMREHLRITCRAIIEKFYPQVINSSMSDEIRKEIFEYVSNSEIEEL